MGEKRRGKPTIDQIVDVYEKKGANWSATCRALGGISRNTLYAWRRKSKVLDERMADVEESLIDFSESQLISQIQDGNITAIIFYLKTKGKDRGYVERVEQEVSANPFLDLMKDATSRRNNE